MSREMPYGERLAAGFRMLAAAHPDDVEEEDALDRSIDDEDEVRGGHWDYRRGWVRQKLPDE